MNGKGSTRRQALVPDQVVKDNWERTFQRQRKPEKQQKKDRPWPTKEP